MQYGKFDSIGLKAFRGDTEPYTFSILNVTYDSDGNESTRAGASYTGYSVTMQGRADYDAVQTLFDCPLTDGSNGSNYAVGKFVAVLPASVTAALPDACRYDLQAKSGSTVTTLAHGIIECLRDIAA